ncbi:MAG: VOC family protein [Inquilinus sp.]|nr:VOC family protein [Inquilinus sp.]
MAKVTGIGGVFFKARDKEALTAWYREHLGIEAGEYGFAFDWSDTGGLGIPGRTAWSPFRHDTDYFSPSNAPFMINYRVDDLDGLLAKLRAAGVTVDDKVEEFDYGRFGWAMDPEGNRIELWEPTEMPPE